MSKSADSIVMPADRRDSFSFAALVVMLTAMAAGTGWGIRGQYGHETGAMIAGCLASLTLVLFFVPRIGSLKAARIAAIMTVAIGIGGSMTYGSTVGLTHDQELHGNWEALRWGMLGLAIKGGIWIGFGGAFLGMGLSGNRYRPLEMAALMAALLALFYLGVYLINSPFDPANKKLPALYFSDHWYFEPDRELRHRREIWGGFLTALLGLVAYLRLVRGDRLAARLALFAFIGGAIGFPAGQSLQASHAWNPQFYSEGALSFLYPYTQHFNWWNVMETTFGAIWGATLALGVWLNRHLIDATNDDQEYVSLSPTVEILMLVIHLTLLLTAEFLSDGRLVFAERWYTEIGLVMATIPLVGIAGGRLWPYLTLLPVVALPICGKTLRQLGYNEASLPLDEAWFTYVGVPLAVLLPVATWLIVKSFQQQRANHFSGVALFVMSITFFSLNACFFHFSWPWEEWNGRTANLTFFMVSTICLVVSAIIFGGRKISTVDP